MVREPVKQGGCHPFSLEDLLPFAEWQIRRDQRAASLVTVRENLEQQLRAAATEAQIAKLVTDQQVCFV